MTIIEIPSEIPRAARMTPSDLRIELAVTLFQQGRISFGKGRELADMDFWSFQRLLGSRGIPPHYDLQEYQQDLATLNEMQTE